VILYLINALIHRLKTYFKITNYDRAKSGYSLKFAKISPRSHTFSLRSRLSKQALKQIIFEMYRLKSPKHQQLFILTFRKSPDL